MKAIALISGGLDSTLAATLTKSLGVELVALNTVSPFCLCNHRSSSGCLHGANQVAKELGIKLISVNVAQEFLEIVKNPRHGYGSGMNPCIDCRILLFEKAKIAMHQEGASFVITGEVLGQRPMSQKLNTMRLIEKEAGLEGFVVRPLSAGLLEPTIPEKERWLDRGKLLSLNGRSRKEQFALAREFGINDYPCPSGGCLLIDPEFSKRLKDLLLYGELNLSEVALLKVGRHFRLSPEAKLVVGRDELENGKLVHMALDNDYLIQPLKIAGPTALARGKFGLELLRRSSCIVSRYCDLNGDTVADITYKRIPHGEENILRVSPLAESALIDKRI